jgi:hypothetical protein
MAAQLPKLGYPDNPLSRGDLVVFFRLAIGVGLFAFGFYLGREVGRTESIRDELGRFRAAHKPIIEGEVESVDFGEAPGEGAEGIDPRARRAEQG